MVKFNELSGLNNRCKVIVEDKDYKQFLEIAKMQGYIWGSGEVIKPDFSKPTAYTKVFVITNDMTIYQPSNWISHMSLQNTPEYLFKNLKDNKVVDEHFERTFRTERFNKEFEEAQKASRLAHKKRCEENRKISELQIKYKDITKKLRNYFFVKYENNDELLRLFLLFKKYGYENIYNISLESFPSDPKVICLNNQKMTFYPADIKDCSCGIIARNKFYKTDVFEKMMVDIFKQ